VSAWWSLVKRASSLSARSVVSRHIVYEGQSPAFTYLHVDIVVAVCVVTEQLR